MENGLSNNCVICILQDHTGFMWFGTSDGLNRWDGYTFKVFIHSPEDSSSISNNQIWALKEDLSGRIWIGTNNGLNVYDPVTERFKLYQSDESDSKSLSDNIIGAIFKDSAGTFWIGTENGLNRYHPERDDFTRYFFPGQLDSVSFWWNNNAIRAINEDKNGKLLLGTINDFLIFDPENNHTTTVPYVLSEKKRWPAVSSIYKDRSGQFWIGIANEGVIVYDPDTGKARLHQFDPNDPYSYHSHWSTSIIEDQRGQIWIGTYDQGFSIFDRNTGRFSPCIPTARDDKSLSGYIINCIYQDRQGNMWIGTADAGINLVPRWKKPFKHYVHDPQNPRSLARGEVTNFYEDRTGILWITHIYGVSLLNRKTGNFTHIVPDPQNPDGLSTGLLNGIYEDKYGELWFAITPDINQLNPKTGKFKHFQYSLSDPKSHSYSFTLCCREDSQGTMWFGTQNAGLEKLNRSEETFDRFCYDPKDTTSISDNCINTLYLDKGGRFWIGTGNGLCQLIYDQEGNEKFIRYQPNPSKTNSISGKVILSLYEDRSGRFWIGTNGGLNLFDRENNTFRAITKKDGLPVNTVLGILEDEYGLSEGKAGNLWLRTRQGIVKYDPDTGKMRVFDEGDGLLYCKAIENGYAAFHKAKNGEIYSGASNSAVVFHPDSLRDNPDPPPVFITDVKINYETAKIRNNTPLQRSVLFTKAIRLPHHQNILSFEFAALDYTSPAKNLYAYKLDGVNLDWIYTDASRRFATYTNLHPGEYVFWVKGSNNDGVWNETGTSLRIIITPPWWQTNWAYGFYLLLIVLLIYGSWRFKINRIQMKHRLEMEHLQAEKLKEIDRMKSHFFANISHEFRTPLTLILGPLERLLSRSQEEDSRQDMKIMQRSARRLQRLIIQLLDLSKLEAGQMKLQVREENIVLLLCSFVQAFESLAKMKNIKLVFEADQQKIMGYIDREKLETIVNNLLSNAFKFTPQSGKVVVNCKLNLPENVTLQARTADSKTSKIEFRISNFEYLSIIISDTGRGIPVDRLPHIFDRFYRVDDSYTSEPSPLDSSSLKKYQLSEKFYPTGQEGSGIGLALTKELVEFHKGEISVSSQVGKGTTFMIRLPIGKEAYRKEEIAETATPLFLSLPREEEKGNLETVDTRIQTIKGSKKDTRKSLPILLVVEDNPDMRIYLRSNLENTYRIIEAEDGEKGFIKCAKALPDLVISDVIMPRMDGFQLCARLKQDERTSHIPVILLTARAAAEDRIGGLETGADDYIIKPFDARELQVRVKNLIQQRQKLRERYRKEGILQLQEVTVTSTDQKFLERALNIVETNLSDPEFNTHRFAWEVGMSRMQLHRKMKALTDQAPKEFIQLTRLRRAASLLKQKFGNVAEVAYEVGFNNPAYFAKCFRIQYGLTPFAYLKQEATQP